MKITQTLAILEQMRADGIIPRYAIGGAVAASFYLEPVATQDVDVFVVMEATLTPLTRIYQYLQARGCTIHGEYIVIGEWPVQFLPADSSLIAEALEQAVERKVEGVSTRIFTAEHLAAIALQLGRPKDKTRLVQFLEADVLDKVRFYAILERHGLLQKWEVFNRQFLDER